MVMTMYVRLSQMREGERGTVVNVQGGHRVRQRLLGMGIAPGTKIVVIKAGFSGPYIIALGSTRLALGRGIAERIIVRRER
ncbi:MAG: Fe2+ transport protein, putative [Thermococcus sibiricus]|uniref:Fe2+ transport protein, putative n=3 Tax=Thermococcaceae TaxID=2259 RepID=C6A1S2_THESM|nr:Fe2+ transport protein, putative [Thermococcus sibiricus MM 739]KUK18285.1 MAG: Fe2+ transport protein, putative [Thermococcus sibiricus]KUK28879.1 MAG: Fe2+ transport protein, putative [Thermococcus sp. 40_45]